MCVRCLLFGLVADCAFKYMYKWGERRDTRESNNPSLLRLIGSYVRKTALPVADAMY